MVEYDLDEEDDQWLRVYNAKDRRKGSCQGLTPETFEFMMDRLEKELVQKVGVLFFFSTVSFSPG